MKIRVGNQSIEITHPDKVLFPKGKITKQELVEYYLEVADWMLPLIKDRPISMKRYPQGIGKEGFFQKNAPEKPPDWIKTALVTRKEKGKTLMLLCNDRASLAWLANQNCITPHIWLSKIDKPNYPDRMVFDLDPPPKKSFRSVAEAAFLLRDVLAKAKLQSYVMTTGSKGAHVIVPIKPTAIFDEVRKQAREIAAILVQNAPKLCTLEARKEKRKSKIYIDTARNGYGQTVVAPYAVRALPKASLAIPLSWDALSDPKIKADAFHLRNFSRKGKNPWARLTLQKFL